MKVSTKGHYGIRALIELTHHYGESRPMQSSEIAARQDIPESYLEQLLTALHRSGFVRSRRGPQGGHVLAKSPADISLGMIVASMEGRPAPLDCIDEPSECSVYSVCAQREVWQTVDQAILQMLDATSIADLASRQRQRESLVGQRT